MFKATLVRGNTYKHLVSGINFRKGVPVKIDDELKAYLEANAVEVVNDSKKERFVRPKFRFEAVGAESATAKAATPARGGRGGRKAKPAEAPLNEAQ